MPQDPRLVKTLHHVTTVWQWFENEFVKQFVDEDFHDSIKINRAILVEAIGHALRDMDRMAALHLRAEGKRPDRHKYAGFMSKWIAKFRPVYVDRRSVLKYPRNVLKINAYFALHVFRSYLEIPGDVMATEMKVNLGYAFHFRDERGETLALLAYTCEKV